MEDELVDIDGDTPADAGIEPAAFYDTPGGRSSLSSPAPAAAPTPAPPPPPPLMKTAVSSMSTRRSSRAGITPPGVEASDRTTRSSTQGSRPRFQPKLKLKVSERQAAGNSFLGPYDRELDSDDEDLGFEEQFVLRLPPGEDCDKLRAMVEKREITKDVWFKFKDSRRGVFHIGNSTYSAKLVDLPCIVESQKTLDNKNLFKVADICQMLVVEEKGKNDDEIANNKSFNIDEFIWPHGITPPLHWARKRRFRKRVNRRTIETVEQEVERLLAEDAKAAKVEYEVLDNVNPDLSDSEFIDADEPTAEGVQDMDEAEFAVPALPVENDEDEEEEDEEEGDIDEELAAELAREMGEDAEEDVSESQSDESSEEDGDEEDEDGDEEDEDDEEVVQAKKLLLEEIRDLDVAVAKKETEIHSAVNPLIKKRFEDQLKKMRADLEQKQSQREQMVEEQRLRKQGRPAVNQETGEVVQVVDPEGEEDVEMMDGAGSG